MATSTHRFRNDESDCPPGSNRPSHHTKSNLIKPDQTAQYCPHSTHAPKGFWKATVSVTEARLLRMVPGGHKMLQRPLRCHPRGSQRHARPKPLHDGDPCGSQGRISAWQLTHREKTRQTAQPARHSAGRRHSQKVSPKG